MGRGHFGAGACKDHAMRGKPIPRIGRLIEMITRRPVIAVLIVGVVACGGPSAATTTTTIPGTTTTSGIISTTTTPTTVPDSTTTTGSPGTTTLTDTTLPGEAIEFGPVAGDRLMVIGVSHDDVLNLRRLPGTAFEIIAGIPSDYLDLTARGNTRDIGTSLWVEVSYEGDTGWVHMSFVGYQGSTDDLTAFVVDQLGERPTAGSMTELGAMIADLFVSDDPPTTVTKVIDDTVGDLGEVTYDVVGFGDDSVRGVRLHVFGEQFEGGFAFRNLEVTYLCGRGVTEDELCV